MRSLSYYLSKNFDKFLRMYFINNCIFFVLRYFDLINDDCTILAALIIGLLFVGIISVFQYKGWHDNDL